MVDSAALLVDEILPHQPMRQWVLTVPLHRKTSGVRQTLVYDPQWSSTL